MHQRRGERMIKIGCDCGNKKGGLKIKIKDGYIKFTCLSCGDTRLIKDAGDGND